MPADLQKARELFLHAVGKLPAEEWDGYVGEACGGDVALEQQVKALLQVHREAGSFLDRPAPAVGATGAFIPAPGEAATAAPLCECPGTMIGPYKLLQQIGEGGMGVVWMVQQTQPVQRKVALKVIKPGMDSRQVIARFEAERQALAMMDHVNIARVFDGGTTEAGRPYFVMELVHGVPITKYCDDNHLTPRERLELFVPVCQAIQHAHQKGIIHRDIKPSNVMVTLYDGKPVPKVIDFGVAKATEQKLTERTLFTQYGTMVGTLEYMSPEQAEMSALGVDTRSDIYSLGVLLYELLTGSTPLSRKRVREAAYGEILRMIREEDPPKPSTRLSDSGEALASISAQRRTEPAKLSRLMRGELDWIVMKCLEKDRNRRYETANGFATDVQRYLNDETVQACPPSARYCIRKFARRNKRVLATAALFGILLLAAVGTVAGTLGWASRDAKALRDQVARDTAARESALDSVVNRSLDDAAALIDDAKWPDAVTTVQRAEKLLTAAGRQELPPRLQALQKDLAMAQRLEDIYSRPRKEEFFPGLEPDTAYRDAFEDYGIRISTLPVGVAVEMIRARSIRLELVRSLDFWSGRRRALGNEQTPTWQQLLEIATLADPDPWRVQLRLALGKGDRKALESLAATGDIRRLPPTTLYQLGTALYANGAIEQGGELLRQAQVQYSDDWWINNILGWYCETARPPQYDDALRFYTAAQAVRPQNPYNLDGIGRMLKQKKAYAEAVVVYSRAIELNSKNVWSWMNRGLGCFYLGQQDKAIADFSVAIELDPKLAAAWNKRGAAFSRLGQQDKAIADCSKAIELDSKYAAAWNNRGAAYAGLTQWEKAITDFSKAIELVPKDAGFRGNRGRAYDALGQREKAIVDYSKVIELDPMFLAAWLGRAGCQRVLGHFREARSDYEQALRLNPTSAAVHNDLAWLLATCLDAKFRDPKRAVELGKKAVELAPKAGELWNTLGVAHYRFEDWPSAIAALEKSIELRKGGDSGDWFFLAMAQWHLGNKDQARKRYDQAVEWMDKNQPKNEELRRFRTEAAELLGIKN